MNHRTGFRLLTGLGAAALAFCAGAASAEKVDTIQFDQLDIQALQTANEVRTQQFGEIEHFAEPQQVALSPHNAGTIEQLADGRTVWRLRIESANAYNINLGTLYDVPPSTVMYLIDQAGNTPVRSFTADDNRDSGELWTPVIDGSAVEIYVETSADEFQQFADGFQITSVNLGFQTFGPSIFADPADDAAQRATDRCHIDVECSQADPWRDQVNSVGAYTIGGFGVCSGAMINNTEEDGTPYFMTAYHCLDSVGFNVNSMVVYWNFQNSTCRTPNSPASGQNGNGTLSQFTFGGILRMSHDASDWSLVELDNVPNPSFNVVYAGWDRRTSARTAGVGIHHPGVEEKRISFENGLPFFDSVFFQGQGNISTWGVSWDAGGVEGGSSGSPYFNNARRVIGTATAATFQDICFGQFTFYGRLDVAWNGGGTNSTRLSTWLDPNNTGAQFIDGLGDATPPQPFNLLTPANNATGVTDPPTFDWGDSANAEEYRVRVTATGGATVIDETIDASSSEFTATAGVLSQGASYTWSVIAINPAGTQLGTPTVSSFTMAEPAPAAFDLLSPVGASDVSLTPVLDWSDSDPGVTYSVRLRVTGTSTDLINTTTTDTSLDVASTTLGSLDFDTSYTWVVVAANSGGVTPATPSSATFSTEAEPVDCPADVDGSGFINADDLLLVLGNFGLASSDGDTNGDGLVNADDLLAILGAFGTACP